MEENLDEDPTLLISTIMEECMVGKFCFSLVINYTCMNTSKSKMKKLVKKQMWKKARVTYCNILLKPP